VYGHYLFNRTIFFSNNEGNISTIPFDLHKLKLKGEPKAVLSGVNTATWSGAAFISVSDKGNLIFLPRNIGSLHAINIVDRLGKLIDKDSIPLTTFEIIGYGWHSPNISPSGKRIACTGRSFGSADIWVLNLTTGLPERITFDPSEDEYPVWSPDGNAIAYTSTMTGTTRRLFIKDLSNAENPHLIRTWPRHIHFSSWSPDKKWLSAYDYTSTNGTDCFVLPLDSGEIKQISFTKANELNGQFSPDGRWLAFQSDESGRYEIYVVSFPIPESKRQISNDGGMIPRWDRDGKFIYYFSGGYIIAQPVELSNEFKIGKPVKLFLANASDFNLSPDGQKFYLVRNNIKRSNPPLNLITNWFQELENKKGK
jgi:dipeptidyl aminopeptidase/acylaminoacyl peptidase